MSLPLLKRYDFDPECFRKDWDQAENKDAFLAGCRSNCLNQGDDCLTSAPTEQTRVGGGKSLQPDGN
jgi:hypothetical protein